jgi:hypothetical protein
MKIINSHYIPLPEPHWLIADTNGFIYEQLGTLTVVESASKNTDGCSIVTHSYPVIANAITDVYDESKEDGLAMNCSLAPADGRVLGDTELEDCFRLCPSNHRVVPYLKFNLLAMKYLSYAGYENFDLAESIGYMQGCNIRLDFPKQNEQTVQFSLSNYDGNIYMESDLGGLYFTIPVGRLQKGNKLEIDSDKLLMEVVNQARAYLMINPKYRFHFTTAIDDFQDVIDLLNNELNDYLERKED